MIPRVVSLPGPRFPPPGGLPAEAPAFLFHFWMLCSWSWILPWQLMSPVFPWWWLDPHLPTSAELLHFCSGSGSKAMRIGLAFFPHFWVASEIVLFLGSCAWTNPWCLNQHWLIDYRSLAVSEWFFYPFLLFLGPTACLLWSGQAFRCSWVLWTRNVPYYGPGWLPLSEDQMQPAFYLQLPVLDFAIGSASLHPRGGIHAHRGGAWVLICLALNTTPHMVHTRPFLQGLTPLIPSLFCISYLPRAVGPVTPVP